MRKQSGFTLIELAIVLVIIGLLLGGVLKGQELINSAKVKNMASDFKNVQIYIYGYQDRFKALPGDDHSAVAHLGTAATPAKNDTQNGVIQGAWNTSNSDDESCVFWQHVRMAGLASGSTTVSCVAANTYQPRNADGGLVGVQSVSGFSTITGMSGAYVVCSDGILGRFAVQLDTTLDDGETSTGSVRAVASATGTGTTGTGTTGTGTTGTNAVQSTNVVPSNTYTVCMAF